MLKGKWQFAYVMLITGVFFNSCEKEVSSDTLVERNGLKYEVNSEKPYSGRSVEFFEGGEVKRESKSYKDGQLDGVFRTWFKNGQISSEHTYKDGLADGLDKLWREDGQQLAESSWKADKASGVAKFWYENGQLKSEESYVDDKLQGMKKVWYENGQQQFEGVFKDGQLAGKSQRWYDNGTLEIEAIFLEGKKDGLWTFWNRNGEKSKELEYENGLLTNTILFQAVADYDGNVYETIKVGDQVWMAENLRVTHYRDGTAIPNIVSGVVWSNTKSGAYCFYDYSKFGALYNWYAVNDSRNIAPEGWHVPSDDDWKELEVYLGMSQSEADDTGWRGTNEGSMLAGKAELWESGKLEKNSEFGLSGFNALPRAERDCSPLITLGNLGYESSFWSTPDRLNRTLGDNHSEVGRNYQYDKRIGISVRCVKD